jgi:hypothetical protein
MTTLTFDADEQLVEAARERARRSSTTLEAEFQRWLTDYARRVEEVGETRELLDELRRYVRTGGRKFTREEMNER